MLRWGPETVQVIPTVQGSSPCPIFFELLKLEKTMSRMSDIAVQFCEEQATKGADFDTTMSDLVRGGNPTADAFIAWVRGL